MNLENNQKNQKWLITGATGFVGEHLISCINKNHPEWEIFALVRSSKKFQEKNLKATLVEGDLLGVNGPQLWVKNLPSDLTGIVHVAGLIHAFSKDKFYQVNTQGTESLIKALREKSSDPLKFILISSLAALGPIKKTKNKNKNSIIQYLGHPVGHYGNSKLQAEKRLQELSPQNWITSVIRPPIVIGPGDPAIFDIYTMVRKGIILTAGLSGNKKPYSFVCIFDLVGHITQLMENNANQKEIYSFFPQTVTMGEICSTMAKYAGKKRLLTIPVPTWSLDVISSFGKLPFLKTTLSRLTPDKVHEIKADGFICPPSDKDSGPNAYYEFKWDLDKTIQITCEDYKKRHKDWGKITKDNM